MKEMTPRERVQAACRLEPTDKVPLYHASISSRAASWFLGREAYVGGGIQQWREALALWQGEDAHKEFLERTKRDSLELPDVSGTDLVRVTYWRAPEKPTRLLNEFTFFYGDPEKNWRIMRFDPETELYQVTDCHPPKEPTEEQIEEEIVCAERGLENYHPTAANFPDIIAGLEWHRDYRAVPGTGVGIGISNRSQTWLMMVVLRPDLIQRWVEARTEYAVRNIEAQSGLDVQIMLGGGDLATNAGPLYSPGAFKEFMTPNLAKITETCHRHGKLHFFASDGNLWPIADHLFPVVDGFYEIDRRAGMDMRKLRKRYPHLLMIGNISSHTLHMGSVAEVTLETRACIEEAKELGGVIVGCSNLIVPQTPKENLVAMQKTLERYR